VREAALYGVAAASYIGLGVLVPELLVSWPVGAAYLLLVAWVVPALVRRFR
jgi:hypothetical protein